MDIKIPTPTNFSYRRTVASHGWYQLPPFGLEKWELSRVIDVGKKPPVTIFLTERKNHVRVSPGRPLLYHRGVYRRLETPEEPGTPNAVARQGPDRV